MREIIDHEITIVEGYLLRIIVEVIVAIGVLIGMIICGDEV